MPEQEELRGLPGARTLSKASQIRALVIGVVALVVLFLVVTAVRGLLKPREVAAPSTPAGSFRPTPSQLAELKIEPVRTAAEAGEIDATGMITVDDDNSTPVILPYAGLVTEVLIQAGQHVSKGQPLFRIASSDFVDARNNLITAVSAQATATAQLHVAEDNEKRQAEIYQSAGGALKDYRQSQSDLVGARSALRTADSALTSARNKLTLLGKSADELKEMEATGANAALSARTVFNAPASGVVATRDVAPGQYVTAGGDKPLMTITDLTHVWLVAQVAESETANVHMGDAVDVTTPAFPGRVFHAVIDNIGAALDPNTHRLPVRASVANPDEALKPQMFASFTIRRPAGASSTVVPASAVIHEGDDARVWVLDADGLLYARSVNVTDSANGVEIVSSGLKPGERIVTAGALFVNEAGVGE